jgi:putative Mg2+ transporter-C (MgtC) family protein
MLVLVGRDWPPSRPVALPLAIARARLNGIRMRPASISDGEILLRLAIVVALCGAIGLERQARDQIAGLRTHVLVGLGSALFTLVSAYGFTALGSAPIDPTRIAAQIVSGIGFLGGGVILRYGVTVRGVTTAAALWISAAIGMATAAGFYVGAIATTVVALAALVVLRRLKPFVRRRLGGERLSLELDLARGASIRSLLGALRRRRLRVEGLESRILDDGSEHVRLDVRAPATLDIDAILSGLSRSDEVARIELAVLHSVDLDADDDQPAVSDGPLRRLAPAPRSGRPRTPLSATRGTGSGPPHRDSSPH